jgi:adenine-specific DNA-methyltransferase
LSTYRTFATIDEIVDKDRENTVLEKHLRAYTKKNTTDYFIHKDLKGFLTRELDFYIKNEVFHLDDLGGDNEVSVEQYVTRVKVMKKICLKIIDFLAQIEDFQKMLFEKKKFVVKTDYCMTLDNVPEELYPEILENENQLNEWNVLYGIGKESSAITSRGSESIDEGYLNNHPYLVLDTKFFDQEFKDNLLASFDDIDEAVGGLMINSENWQALNLMQEKYKEKVKCVYIDPPYNTGNDEFIYKDNYQHSSWLSMMWNRLEQARELLSVDGTIYSSIDDGEQARLKALQAVVFGDENFVSNIIWQKKYTRSNDARWFSDNHDFIMCYAKEKDSFSPNLLPRSEELNIAYSNPDNHPKGPWKSTPLHAKSGKNPNFSYTFKNGMTWTPPPGTFSRYSEDTLKRLEEEEAIWFGANGNSIPSRKTFLCEVKDGITSITLWLFQEVGHTHEAITDLKNLFPNNPFPNPKPIRLIRRIAELSSDSNKWILDFFAGSGTTAHAVLNLNKEGGGNRKYILVEMGDYFDTVMKPRIQKVMYSDTWKDGKPQSNEGVSHIFKYQVFEQYEDTLNNIEFTENGSVQRTLIDMDGYFLRYTLDFETRNGSPCRFNVEKLSKPFDYTLKITEGNELKEQTVDLIETFNYLLGIHIKQIKTFKNNGTYYKVVLGKKDEDDITIIWRDTENIDLKADKTFIERTILGESNPSKTYINSDFYVEGAHPIEPEFKKLMVV